MSNGQVLPVAKPQLLEPLKQPGVDEHLLRAGVEQVLGAGHRARGAEEGQGDRSVGHREM
jgi:hypothetical protein